MPATLTQPAIHEEIDYLGRACKASRIRGLRQFAEEEIVLPAGGTAAGRRFAVSKQPFSGPLLDELENPRWRWVAVRGPAQSSKSICTFVIPAMYHLFELEETIILASPNDSVAEAKWVRDLRPMIERSRYAKYLPKSGRGSEGGNVRTMIEFGNDTMIRFMTAGGGDKSRAEFTARVVFVTEANAFGKTAKTSDEGNKLKQLEARTQGHDDRFKIFAECTPLHDDDVICSMVKGGTDSRFVVPCPHCSQWITPERTQLRGWQACASDAEALRSAYFVCPNCDTIITQEERRETVRHARLLHKGQSIDPDGAVTGQAPDVLTFGCAISAYMNMFMSAGTMGMHEWKASRDKDTDSAEKDICQFKWGIPYKAPDEEISNHIRVEDITARAGRLPEGILPRDTESFSIGTDINKYALHWVAVARDGAGAFSIPSFGVIAVPSHDMSENEAVLFALRRFRDEYISLGWKKENGENIGPDSVFVDSGSWTKVVYGFCLESGARYRAIKGAGGHQNVMSTKRQTGSKVIGHGENYAFVQLPTGEILVEIDTTVWKPRVQNMLLNPKGKAESLVFFEAPPFRFKEIAKHFTSGWLEQPFVAGKGTVVRWFSKSPEDHWHDAAYVGLVANNWAFEAKKIMLLQQANANQQSQKSYSSATMPDGRPLSLSA